MRTLLRALRSAVLILALAAAATSTTSGARAHTTAIGGVQVRSFQYAGTDNRYQRLTATWDPNRTGAPWVMTVHGGSWVYGSEADTQPVVDVLHEHGFQVFNISYRFVTAYPHAPAVPWTKQRDDVLTALAWVRSHAAEFGIDPDRGALYGSSAGGQLATIAGLSGDGGNGIRAVVSASGVEEPERLWEEVRGHRPWEPATPEMATLAGWAATANGCPFGAHTPGCAKRWQAFDPANYLSPHDPAVALYNGTSDRTVPYQMARSFRAVLDAHDIGGSLTLVPDIGHDYRATFDDGPNQAAVLRFLEERTAVSGPPTLSSVTADRTTKLPTDAGAAVVAVGVTGATTGTVTGSVDGLTVDARVLDGRARLELPRLAPGPRRVAVRYLGTAAVQPSHTSIRVRIAAARS